MKMHCNKSLTMRVLSGLVVAGCFLPPQLGAQVTDIKSFLDCVNMIGSGGGNVDTVASVCVPSSGCYYTTTMSEESPQNGCTLRDGTRLPRVIFSCAGPGGSQTLRFRPSFSLCTLGKDAGVISHIEMGEDTGQVIDEDRVQKMGDIEVNPSKQPFVKLTELPGPGSKGVLDTTTNNLGCNDCHDRLGHVPGTPVVNVFRPVRPALSEGTIDTSDPTVQKPLTPVPLSVICDGIKHSSQLAKNKSKYDLASKLCDALAAKAH